MRLFGTLRWRGENRPNAEDAETAVEVAMTRRPTNRRSKGTSPPETFVRASHKSSPWRWWRQGANRDQRANAGSHRARQARYSPRNVVPTLVYDGSSR